MKFSTRGFTLIELMIVLAIVSLLSGVGYVNFSEARAQARDIERKADLRALQTAIELYRQQHGRYPAGCKGPNQWSGQDGTDYACEVGDPSYNGPGQYIVSHDLADPTISFAPGFMSVLPTDPKLPDGISNVGYRYVTNAEGTAYKVMTINTVEKEVVNQNHPFRSCEITPTGESAAKDCDPSGGARLCDVYLCERVYTGNSYAAQTDKPNQCSPAGTQFKRSYAVWGGQANPNSSLNSGTEAYTANQERQTEAIWCK